MVEQLNPIQKLQTETPPFHGVFKGREKVKFKMLGGGDEREREIREPVNYLVEAER